MSEKCEDCIFYQSINLCAKGICRRRAPVLNPDADKLLQHTAEWPIVGETWWCGEFKPASREEDEL